MRWLERIQAVIAAVIVSTAVCKATCALLWFIVRRFP